jgi:phosphoglycolate phosphatase
VNILFDLDGTLTDSAVGITRCLQHALTRLGREVPAASALRRFVGPPLHETFAELLETRDAAVVDGAVRLYRERFQDTGMFENEVYPGIREGLDSLSANGHRMWVVTSKPTVYANRIVDHFGLRRWIQDVHGSELSGIDAEKRRLIRRALDRSGLAALETCVVGDRVHDVRGARANGVKCVGVLWGYGSAEELRQAAPDHLVSTMSELCDVVESEGRP